MVDQFVFITDTHLAAIQPVNRIDDYNESILNKIEFVCKYCKKHGVNKLVHGGDLAHSHKIKSQTLLAFSDLMIKYNLQLYYVFGNHDVQGANFEFIDKTQLGFLTRYSWFHELNDHVYEFDNFLLSGYNYTINRKQKEFPFPKHHDSKKKKVLVLHANIYDVANENPMIEKIGVRNNELETDADLVLCGHTHYGWKRGVLVNDTTIINPGSMARVKYDEHIKGYGPRAVHVKISKNIKFQFVEIPVVKAFDENKYRKEKKVKENRTKFIEKFKELSYTNSDVAPDLEHFIEHPPEDINQYMTNNVKRLAFSYLHKAQGNVT